MLRIYIIKNSSDTHFSRYNFPFTNVRLLFLCSLSVFSSSILFMSWWREFQFFPPWCMMRFVVMSTLSWPFMRLRTWSFSCWLLWVLWILFWPCYLVCCVWWKQSLAIPSQEKEVTYYFHMLFCHPHLIPKIFFFNIKDYLIRKFFLYMN